MNAICSEWNALQQFKYSIQVLQYYVQISSPMEKYLPNLHNLMYKCSSSVKALAPKNHKNNIT
jgi:hypothetical protein